MQAGDFAVLVCFYFAGIDVEQDVVFYHQGAFAVFFEVVVEHNV